MKIYIRPEETYQSQSVPVASTFRYIGINRRWETVNSWEHQGLDGFNLVGQGHSDSGANSACIPCAGVSFVGFATKIVLSFNAYVTDPNHTFRWAVTTMRADNKYQGYGEVYTFGQLAQGTITPKPGTGTRSFEFPIDGLLPSGTSFYIYLWRYYASYGNMHINGGITVNLYTSTNGVGFVDATPYVWDGSWKQATPAVRDGNQWRT